MSDKPNDGGPAFPFESVTAMSHGAQQRTPHPGMSLRDYFAAAALTGMRISDPGYEYEGSQAARVRAAQMAYAMADEMLAAREVAP